MIGKCLFPVAGYGTRFLPATKSMPKEMLPVVNKPLVQYGVREVPWPRHSWVRTASTFKRTRTAC